MITLTVPGAPTGKGRPKFVRATGRTYTPASTQSAEQRIQSAWYAAGEPRIEGRGAIKMYVELVLGRPQNHWRRDGTLGLAGDRAPWPVKKPDADNALKLVCDALNGMAYIDDVQVTDVRVVRRWAAPREPEHTVVRIEPLARPERMAA